MQTITIDLVKLKKILKQKRITYDVFCKKSGIKLRNFKNKINDNASFTLSEILIIIKLLNIDIYEIVKTIKQPPPNKVNNTIQK